MQFGEWKMKPYLDLYAKDFFIQKVLGFPLQLRR
jgi:hypothetical protein